MKPYKKTLVGSIVAFFIGTSCCWLSSLAIWIGGATFIGVLGTFIGDIQILLISAGLILLISSLFLFLRNNSK